MANRRMLLVFAAVCGVSPLAACSDQKSANESNFAAAINAFLAEHPNCLVGTVYPAEVYPAEVGVGGYHSEPKAFDALVEAGLLKREEFRRPSNNPAEQAEGTNRYTLTDKGSAAHSERGWCYGTRKVVKILSFTEPTEALGAKMSQVLFTSSYVDLPDWAKNKAVVAAFPQLQVQAANANKPPQEQLVLVLTNHGWQVAQ